MPRRLFHQAWSKQVNLRPKISMERIAVVFLLVLFSRISVLAQGAITLIGPSIRNGSFEDGVLSPWYGNGIGVQNDSAFAAHGSWYAAFNDPLLSPLAIQQIPANPSDGLDFVLTFDARTGTPGLNTLSVQLNTRAAGDPLNAIVTPVASPPASLTEWRSYEMRLRFSGGGWTLPLGLGISFTGAADEPRIAYLDNVILQQVPEPASLALFCSGGFLFWAWRRG